MLLASPVKNNVKYAFSHLHLVTAPIIYSFLQLVTMQLSRTSWLTTLLIFVLCCCFWSFNIPKYVHEQGL